jgi:hypothetical protein
MRFEAPWDLTTKAVTVGALAVWLAVALYLGWIAYRVDQVAARVIMAVAGLPPLLIVPLLLLWSPQSYEVDARGISVKRRIGVVRIPLGTIKRLEVLDDRLSMRRDFASGGLFGYFGAFSEATLGRVAMYATRGSGRVAILTQSGTVVVTPDSVVGFVEEVARLRR